MSQVLLKYGSKFVPIFEYLKNLEQPWSWDFLGKQIPHLKKVLALCVV